MKRLILILVCFLYYVPQGHASDNTLPPKMQGEWSLPDCKYVDEFLVTTPHLVLNITSNQVRLDIVQDIVNGPKGDFQLIKTQKEQFIARTTNDGIFEIAYPDFGETLVASTVWESQPIGQRFEYTHCAEISHPLNNIGIETTKRFDRIMDACPGETCAKKIFGMVDKNGNGLINRDELLIALKRLIFIKEAMNRSISAEGLRLSLETIDRQATVFSEILIVGRDLNRDQNLSFDELHDIFSRPPQHPSGQAFLSALTYLKPFVISH